MLSIQMLVLALNTLALSGAPASSSISAALVTEEVTAAMPQQSRKQAKKDRKDKDDDDDDDDDDGEGDDDDGEGRGDDDDDDRRRARGPAVCSDANGDGICDNKTRRVDKCADKNRDGFCDGDRRDKDDFCLDQNADGRCDTSAYPVRTPRTLPAMVTVATLRAGNRTVDVNRWLGGERLRFRFLDANSNGTPERITFVNLKGEVVQVWNDTNGDGRADNVEIWRKGAQVRTITA